MLPTRYEGTVYRRPPSEADAYIVVGEEERVGRCLGGIPSNPLSDFPPASVAGIDGVRRGRGQRGTAEQWIKEGKAATRWTRLSCHRFRANEVRLLFGVIAYNLGNLLRRLVLPLAILGWSLTSLQQRLFKTGGHLIRHADTSSCNSPKMT